LGRPASQGYSTVTTICFIFGVVAGEYEADVRAAAYDTAHVRIEVPAHAIQPYECCAIPYAPQTIWVDLDPFALPIPNRASSSISALKAFRTRPLTIGR